MKKVFFYLPIIIIIFVFIVNSVLYASNTENPNFGGRIVLENTQNIKVDSLKLKQPYNLVFFGYSTCPSVCPTTLHNISLVLEKHQSLKEKFQVLFITLDPEHDTKEALSKFSKQFDNSIEMLTGPKSEIEAIVAKYKVYMSKNSKTKEIDHTSFIYIMNNKGEYLDHVMGNDMEGLEKKLLFFKR